MEPNSTQKEPLLFLCHRIPFPPNKGDKIRSFNILKKLNEKYEVHLGCFIDDPFDKQYVNTLAKHCASLFYLDQHKTLAKLKGLSAFLTGKPITLPYYFDKRMSQWVNRTTSQHNIRKLFVYSSSMAQYVESDDFTQLSCCERIIDFVDVDSDKWRQYAQKKTGIAKWVFEREYQLLAQYEDAVCADFDHSLFVSPDEASLFLNRQPIHQQGKVHGLLNGVDIDFFDPDSSFADEALLPNTPYIVFTGAMDYWANIDAVLWFVKNVWPIILQKNQHALFAIVGGNPSAEIQALAKLQGIVVTGRVHDIRPFIKQAHCVVAPLQIARGIQNKVLEAMSLNRPVVVSTMAMEGINAQSDDGVVITDDKQAFANACLSYLQENDANEKPIHNRQWVIEHFTWQQTLKPLEKFFSLKQEGSS